MTSDEVQEIKRHFGVVAEGLQSQIKMAVELLDGKIGAVDTRVARLEAELKREFEEVKAMIKFSYAELDRRVTSLETGFGLLEARLRKVEARLT